MAKIDKNTQFLTNKLEKAAKEIAKEIDIHFKKDKWPLRWSFLVDDVFQRAFGLHVENYLLNELRNRNKYVLKSKANGEGLVVDLLKNLSKNEQNALKLKSLLIKPSKKKK